MPRKNPLSIIRGMKIFSSLFHFLASVRFALILLLFLCLFIIFGSFTEGTSGSHQRALALCYRHPLFFALLAGLFVNILLAALRRWPWKWSQLPFLLAHLGLLMVIGANMVKGTALSQGRVTLLEGSSTCEMVVPNSYALLLEDRNGSHHTLSLTSQKEWECEKAVKDVYVKILAHHPHVQLPVPRKLEDRRPAIYLELRNHSASERIWLTYDQTGTAPKRSLLGGSFFVRFQPNIVHLPYQIHLKEARCLSYPASPQPLSYECDLLIKDTKGVEWPVTLSMNHVHQTRDGYRFYLSNISDPLTLDAKYVQIGVERNRVKYWITYPGSALICLGTLGLYLQKMGRKKS